MSRFLFCLLVVVLQSCASKEKVSLIVHNARVYTLDDSFSVQEAFAVKDGKILATGTSRDILERYGSDSILDAKGQPVFPGLIDAHCHFTGYATDMWKCELFGTKSFEEIIEKISAYAPNAPGEWIYGRGWDQNDWPGKQFPDKRRLHSLFPNRPVFLKRIDGHAALANQYALNLAGIHAGTKIPGGEVELKDGKLTGILIDNAMDELEKHIPLISDSLASRYFLKAQEECFSLGLTSVHDCGISERILHLVDKAQQSGLLKMKIFALLSDSASYYDRWLAKGPYKTERLHMGGFKLYADGALGSRGACLIDAYSDKKGWKGFLLRDSAYLNSVAAKLAGSNLQLCTHAIGDSGNRQVLRAYAKVLKPGNDRRWRIEHAQVVNPSDFHFFSDYNIIPSVQPTHATSDMYWVEERLGKERVTHAYAYQQLWKTNGWIPLGTDFPVEYISPFKTFYAAVQRRDAEGFPAGGFQAENGLRREQAIRGMTVWAAKAAFEEKQKGSLEKGKAADFIILNTDLMTCEPNRILSTQVLATYCNGERVYGKP
ncbi:MAG TPA: amidohydrolase [Chitinophagaceae bacterium]|nr:amidohydrolase [Chitinophagaceae bacterium]